MKCSARRDLCLSVSLSSRLRDRQLLDLEVLLFRILFSN